jgi:hypothetical protein
VHDERDLEQRTRQALGRHADLPAARQAEEGAEVVVEVECRADRDEKVASSGAFSNP